MRCRQHDRGDLFCRTCGAKLNIDELRPESFAEMEKTGAAQRIGKILGRIVILVVLLGLVRGADHAVPPPRNLVTGDLSEKDVAALKAKYQRMQQPSRKAVQIHLQHRQRPRRS